MACSEPTRIETSASGKLVGIFFSIRFLRLVHQPLKTAHRYIREDFSAVASYQVRQLGAGIDILSQINITFLHHSVERSLDQSKIRFALLRGSSVISNSPV